MKICEIFSGIQGESTYAGMPCLFIRLTGCNLRCSYCDTTYSYDEGREMSVEQITECVKSSGLRLVEITGGEPLAQIDELRLLLRRLLDSGYQLLIETNGSVSIETIDRDVTVIMDVKTPSSGMDRMNDFSNFDHIKPADEIKFVICSRDDYDWSVDIVKKYGLPGRCKVLFSPAFGLLAPRELALWILQDRLEVRLNMQLHKYIYDPEERGV